MIRGVRLCAAAGALIAMSGCGSSAAKPAAAGTATTTVRAGSPSTSAAAALGGGKSADSLKCDVLTKEAITASLQAELPGAAVANLTQTKQGAGQLECDATFPPATEGALGITIAIMDGYYDSSGYVPASSRPTVLAAFTAERQKRAAKTFAADAPYVDTVSDAPDLGPDAYFLDTVYRQNGTQDGGVRVEVLVVRATLPFVVVVTVGRGPSSAADAFTKPDARHALAESVTKAVLAAIGT